MPGSRAEAPLGRPIEDVVGVGTTQSLAEVLGVDPDEAERVLGADLAAIVAAEDLAFRGTLHLRIGALAGGERTTINE